MTVTFDCLLIRAIGHKTYLSDFNGWPTSAEPVIKAKCKFNPCTEIHISIILEALLRISIVKMILQQKGSLIKCFVSVGYRCWIA